MHRGRRVAPRPRPRYGRILALAGAFVVTTVAVAAGVGMLPNDGARRAYAASPPDAGTDPTSTVSGEPAAQSGPAEDTLVGQEPSPTADLGRETTALPAGSGTGRRVVFDQSAQRVWLVQDSGEVARTYLVSGSVLPNLDPGTYAVYSTSRWAVGIQDSGVMEYMVRFTRGDSAAIGFHSIPEKNGEPLQTRAQLGTPQSHGCIRQDLPDAIALWDFAPEGTTVVVTA